ncbi:MAG: Holliday junction resolvase RuvX [Flavobacteriaceae bacterium]
MGCLIGLDFGIKYSGISITDPNQIIASPLDTCQTNKLITFISKCVENEKVDAFVIGMPLQKDGSTSDIEKNILDFIKDLKKTFPSYPIYRQDERYTSKISSKVILQSGIKKNKRKNKRLIDKISATLILQSFLEHKFKN